MNGDERRVCCVEGHYEYGGQGEEPSIKLMLDLLAQWGYWPSPKHRQCKTADEARRFLRRNWGEGARGSLLYIASHGYPGGITLSEGADVPLRGLGDHLANNCHGRLVHFSACNVFKDKGAVNDFLRETGALAVSGYGAEVGWAGANKPALLSDLMLLNELWERRIDFSDGRSYRPKLRSIERDLKRRFHDCQFEIVLRPS